MQIKHSHLPHVIAVVVTYQPELETLGQLLDALTLQVKSIVIIDNGSNEDVETWSNKRRTPSVEVVLLGENRGIASAHNVGIQWANNKEAQFVLLLDQDSIPFTEMVEKLKFALLESEKIGDCAPIAAGPISIDSRTAKKSFFVRERYGIPLRSQSVTTLTPDNFLLDVSFLISSGTLINLELFKSVGGMRSNYFIDHVDTEWCFRARAKGFRLLGVPSAQMQHMLGDKVKNVWFFGWRQVAIHSPLRDYYMFRNTLLMIQDVKMSIFWQLHLLWRLVQFSSYFLLFTPQRGHRFYCMALGVVHGMRGISGKLDLKTGQCTQIPKSDLDP